VTGPRLVRVVLAVALAVPLACPVATRPIEAPALSTAAAPDEGAPAPVPCTPAPGPSTGTRPASDLADRLRLTSVHALATGRGQRVAVIDTGVARHRRLAHRLVGLGDLLAGGDGLDDCDGHGTAVAGLIAAAADPGDDLVGVAPDAQILALRQFSPSVVGGAGHRAGDLPSLADALVRAVRAGATVVNISGAVCVPAAQAAAVGAPVRAALDTAARADVVVVAAAGNADGGGCAADDPEQVSLPGGLGDDLITVGAVGPDDRPAAFTVRGPWVDVAAPGTEIPALTPDGGAGARLDGTSFAAPLVAGLVALLRERLPGLTAREITDRITATARRPAAGRDDAVGYGVVDPVAALTAEPSVLPPAARADRIATIALGGATPVAGSAVWPVVALGPLLVAAGAALRPNRRRP
jgi:membrane-anchored mycosin MYCP